MLGDYHLAVRIKPDDIELRYACAAGNLDVVVMTHKRMQTATVNYSHVNIACAFGNQLVVEYLLSLGHQDIHPHRGAEYAAYGGHIKLMKLLLDSSDYSDYSPTLATLNTCLQRACERGHVDVVKYLVDTKKIDADGEYHALHNAGYYGHLEIAKYLIIAFGRGTMIVVDSAVRGRQMGVVSALLYSEPLTQDNFDVLWRSACERCGKEMVDYLIATLAPGLVINYNDGLDEAYFSEKDDIAEYLISLGASDGPDMWGWNERNGISYSDESYESDENDYVDDSYGSDESSGESREES